MNAVAQVIEGQYFRDLMDQPRALQATHAWLGTAGRLAEVRRFLGVRDWRRIVLTGMGSSYHTLHPLNLALIAAGRAPVMIETAELVHYAMPLCDADTLVIAVSQSGGSAETVRLLELNRHATVLGVTNTADSALARGAGLALLTQAGPEFSVSCKTYVTGGMALQWLAAILSDQDADARLAQLAPAAELAARYLLGWRAYTKDLSDRLRGVRHLFIAGRGASLAAVGTGALIIKEAARLHAEGMSSAAFRHGPMEMMQPDMLVAIYSGDAATAPLNQRLARELRARGGRCELIGDGADLPAFQLQDCTPPLRPISEVLPMQMLTLALAGLAGHEAGFFERASKITDTE